VEKEEKGCPESGRIIEKEKISLKKGDEKAGREGKTNLGRGAKSSTGTQSRQGAGADLPKGLSP